MLVKSRNFGHVVYNQQNYIIFYWHFHAEQLLKKTDTQSFSQKIFVYSQDDKSFYKCLNEYGGTFTKIFMITKQGWHKLKNS